MLNLRIRDHFSDRTEKTFDNLFSYQRPWRESYEAKKMYKENPEHYKGVLKEKIRAEHERRNYTYSNENTVS